MLLCSCVFRFATPLSVVFLHIYPFIVRGVFRNPSAHANRMWNGPFSCCIYYICLKTCHVGIYLVNQIMPRNDMLMKWQSVYSIFVLLFLLVLWLCVFYVFFPLEPKNAKGNVNVFHYERYSSTRQKYIYWVVNFERKNNTKKDGCHSFNTWWPIFKITSAQTLWLRKWVELPLMLFTHHHTEFRQSLRCTVLPLDYYNISILFYFFLFFFAVSAISTKYKIYGWIAHVWNAIKRINTLKMCCRVVVFLQTAIA